MLGDLIEGNQYKYELLLCKPSREVIGFLDVSDLEYKPRFNNVDEMQFELKYYQNGLTRIEDTNYNILKGNYLILMNIKQGDTIVKSDYFCISDITDNGIDITSKTVHTYSYDYISFNKKKLRGFKQVCKLYDPVKNWATGDSGIINYILEYPLYNTWSVGYINSELLGIYNSFDISQNTLIDVFKQLEQDFNCFIFFNNVNLEIDIYKRAEIGSTPTIYFDASNYIKSIDNNARTDQVITRLYVYGKNDATISKYNATGQRYIDDFSYFRDNGYFSDSLASEYDAYLDLLDDYQGTFEGYVSQLDSYESQLITLQNQLAVLQSDKVIIEDNMDLEKVNNYKTTANYTTYYGQLTSKNTEISNKQIEIANMEISIAGVETNISNLQTLLSYSTNFSAANLKELHFYIQEDDLRLSSVEDEELLYQYATQYMVLKAVPPINITIGSVDIFSAMECQNSWNNLEIGEYAIVNYEYMGLSNTQIRCVEYSHNPYKNTLSVTFSNSDRLESDEISLRDIFKRSQGSATTLDVERSVYKEYEDDKSSIIQQGDTIDAENNTIQAGDITLTKRGFIGEDIGTHGMLQYLKDKIILSTDSFATFHTLLSGNGLYCENNAGNARIIINPNYGIQIDSYINGDWYNVVYIDAEGNANFSGYIQVGSGTIIDKFGIDPIYLDYWKNLVLNSSFELYDNTDDGHGGTYKQPKYWTTGISSDDSSFHGTYSLKLTTGSSISQSYDAYINPTLYDNQSTRVSLHSMGASIKVEVYDNTNGSYFTLTDESGNTGSSITFGKNELWGNSRDSVSFDPTEYGTCTAYYLKFTNVDTGTGYIDAVMAHPDYNGRWPQLYKDGQYSISITEIDDIDTYLDQYMSNVHLQSVYVQDDVPATPVVDDVWIDTNDYSRYDVTDTGSDVLAAEEVIFTDASFDLPDCSDNNGVVRIIKNTNTIQSINISGTIDNESTIYSLYPLESLQLISYNDSWWIV